ncbi:MAG: sulfotransferase [Cyanobacteria bacterium P01_G01_bin.54]
MAMHLGEYAPNLIMIGAGKVGSTSIYKYLRDHPAVCLSKSKELFYFLPSAIRESHKPWGAITTPEDYIAQFSHYKPGQAIVEISTNYYAYPESAALIKAACPQVKLLMVLRDPANRAFSSYNMRLRNVGDVRPLSKELTDTQSKFIQRGFYFAQLSTFLKSFNREQIKILFFEEFIANKQRFSQELCEFIGIEFFPWQQQYHGRPGGAPQKRWLHQLLSKQNPMRTAIENMLTAFIDEREVEEARKKIIQSNIKKVSLPPALRGQIIQIYANDIAQLEEFLGRDLSHWKKI